MKIKMDEIEKSEIVPENEDKIEMEKILNEKQNTTIEDVKKTYIEKMIKELQKNNLTLRY